ncbi:MAG: hemerythrin domain-containing protein [Methanosarcinales archaeon]|nr:hemerythrin domain-containing protein [Methanosarcinales archaeon]
MDTIKQIMDEHRVIERAIDVLDKINEGLEDGREIPPQLILSVLGVIIECIDEYHLGKEEEILIPFLEEIGKTELLSAIQAYSNTYKDGVQYIDAIIEAMDEYANGDVKAALKIIENGREYVGQVRPVFLQEDESIKSLKKILSKDEMEQLNKKFKDFEYDWDGPQVQKYQKIVRELERKSSLIAW